MQYAVEQELTELNRESAKSRVQTVAWHVFEFEKSFRWRARRKPIDYLTNSVKSALDAVRVSIVAAGKKRDGAMTNKFKDDVMAQRLLTARNCGYSLPVVLRWNAIRYFIMIAVFVSGFALVFPSPRWSYLIIGILCGTVAREIAWIRASQKLWPLYQKVMDWEKVENLAKSSN